MNPIKWSPTPDPMMDELRAIRDEIGAEVQSMSIEQRLKHYQEKANEAAALIGKSLFLARLFHSLKLWSQKSQPTDRVDMTHSWAPEKRSRVVSSSWTFSDFFHGWML